MSALTDVFTAIANAIRSKKGVSTTYKPSEMASAIRSISTGTDTSDATLKNSLQLLNSVTAYSKGVKYTGQNDRICRIYNSLSVGTSSSYTFSVYMDVMEIICFYTRIGVDSIITHYDVYGNYSDPTTKVRKISSSGASTVDMSSITKDGIQAVTRNSSNNYSITVAPLSAAAPTGGYRIIVLGLLDALS